MGSGKTSQRVIVEHVGIYNNKVRYNDIDVGGSNIANLKYLMRNQVIMFLEKCNHTVIALFLPLYKYREESLSVLLVPDSCDQITL